MTTDELKALLDKARDTFCLASPGSDEEFAAYLSGFDSASQIALSHCNALREREARLVEALAVATYACRIVDEAVKEGHPSLPALVNHFLRAVEPARAALAEIEKETGE